MFRYDFIPRFLLPVCALLVIAVPPRASTAGQSAVEKIKQRGVLLWGCDAEGGAPMAFPDPKDPSKLIGFEVDIIEAIAKQLGVKAHPILLRRVALRRPGAGKA